MAKPYNLGSWEPLGEFFTAGGTTRETQMRFNETLANLHRSHNSSQGNFRRAFFRFAKNTLNLATFEAVGQKFGIHAGQIPVDEIDDQPAIGDELRAAGAEMIEAQGKFSAAQARATAVQARLDHLDALNEQLPRLRESLEFVETLPSIWENDIADAENAIARTVYQLPNYSGVGDVARFVLGWERTIATARAAIAAHPRRVEIARKAVADVENEIAKLKKSPARAAKK